MIDERVAEVLGELHADASRGFDWIYGDRRAAEYLNWPLGRVQKLSARGLLPCHRLGQRKAYRTDELDAAVVADPRDLCGR